eukprot:scaffold7464_cov267-Chaetoceros_neogracile.AAC.8
MRNENDTWKNRYTSMRPVMWDMPSCGGWHGVYDLWMGAVSDADYNSLTVLPFLNIYDRGYRAKMVAWKNGKQKVLQPYYANSDCRFNRIYSLASASIACDRGGNKRSTICQRQ